MLAGHYAAAYLAKRAQPTLPLSVVFAAAQFVDIIWAILVLAGVERASLNYALPSNPLVAEHMPYTHSLVGTVVCAALFGGAVFAWKRSGRDATLAGLVVLSHWFLDLLMHRHDLTIAGGTPNVGLALWNHPIVAHTFELALLLGAAALVRTRAVLILTGVLLVVQLYSIFAPPPPTVSQMVISLWIFWVAMPVLAARVERR
jgi:hypothetical protein